MGISQHTPANRVASGRGYRGKHSTAERRRVVSIVVVAAIVAFLGAGVAAAGVTASQSLSPSHNVEAFLQAMVDGRVQDAVAASGGQPTGVSLALLNDNVYRAADNRITDYRIMGTTVNGDNATVSTVITQGTTQLDQTFSLSKSGTVLGLVDSWSLDPLVMGSVSIVTHVPAGQPLVINGVRLAETSPGDTTPLVFAALPGSYSVGVDAEHPTFTVEPVTATVAGLSTESGANPAPVDVVAVLTEEGTSQAIQSVNDFLAACVGQPTLGPEGCPFAADAIEGQTYTDVEWDVVVEPEFTIGKWVNGGWLVETTTPGAVEVTASVSDQADGAVKTAKAHFTGVGCAGLVKLAENGEPEFEPAPLAG